MNTHDSDGDLDIEVDPEEEIRKHNDEIRDLLKDIEVQKSRIAAVEKTVNFVSYELFQIVEQVEKTSRDYKMEIKRHNKQVEIQDQAGSDDEDEA